MAKIRKYKDLLLELRGFNSQDGTYEVALLPSAEWAKQFGEPTPVKVSLNEVEISDWLNSLEIKKIYVEKLILLGKALANRLLPEGAIRNHFSTAVKAMGVDEGVRLRLLIRDTHLQQIPWEYTYLKLQEGEDDRTHFLVLNPKVSLVRHPPQEGPVPVLTLTDPSQLRMLAMFSNPSAAGFTPLDLDTEKGVLERALTNFHVDDVDLKWEPMIKNATEKEMDHELVQKPDIFHFSGHGKFSTQDAEGMLLLIEDIDTLAPSFLGATSLGKKLLAAGVHLAYLGACESSRINGISAWTGIAPALIAAGVPAVVAMQYKLLDDMGSVLSEPFYVSLAAGLTIDEAMTAGRLAVLEKSTDKGVEWGVPTLYLRATDGVLFPALTQRKSPTADGINLAIESIITTVENGGKVIGIVFEKDPGQGTFKVTHKIETVKGTVIGAVIKEWPPRRN
jgi:hypothetical protein